jgi:type I restriction enzyme S subunit
MGMSELPSGWALGSLSDVLRIRNGYAFKSAEFKLEGVPLVRQSNLDGDKVDLSKCAYLDEQYLIDRAGFTLHKGDVLIGMSGSVGKLCTYDQDFAALQNQRVGKIELHASDQTEWRFVWHYLKTVTDALLDKAKGVAVANVSPDDIHSLPLNIPPLAEQTRIAHKLDELLAQVDTLKARIDGIPALLKRFRQSVLAAAVSGRLTEEWRTQHSRTEWRISTFGDGGTVSGGLTKNAKRSELSLEKPYLRVANVHANKLILGDVTYIGLTNKELEKTRLLAGDILIVEGNGSLEHIGRAAIWNDEIPDCSHQNHLIRWRAIGEMQPKFALYQLLSPQGRKQLVEVAKSTTGLHTLSITKVSALVLPVPEKDEQTEIVRRVEQLFAFADQLETNVTSAKSRIDHLTQSILAKAFRGELVPQEPNDEPASVLLERIKAQRATAPKAKRGRKQPPA